MKHSILACLIVFFGCSTGVYIPEEDQGIYECRSAFPGNPVYYFNSRDRYTKVFEEEGDLGITFIDLGTKEQITLYENGHDFYDCERIPNVRSSLSNP